MKKADILNIIKDAEEKANLARDKAISEKERIISKARNDAQTKIEKGLQNAKAEYDRIINTATTEISGEIKILAAREAEYLERFLTTAEASVERTAGHVVAEFGRAVNV